MFQLFNSAVRVERMQLVVVEGVAMPGGFVCSARLKSDVEEVDVEEAVTELVSRQTAYQAAMLATSRVMGLTLADYLR